jgi:hypothetical protein
MRVFSTKDKIKLKYVSEDNEEIFFDVSPMTWAQKTQVISLLAENNTANRIEAIKKAVCFSVKGVTGLFYEDGQPFVLKLENGILSDESFDEISNLGEVSQTLTEVCLGLTTNNFGEVKSQGVSVVDDKKKQ